VILTRVTRCVCEEVAQYVAQFVQFVKINTSLYLWKQYKNKMG
jgi:hypothetical protein